MLCLNSRRVDVVICNMSRPYCKMENRSRSEGYGDEDSVSIRGNRPRDVRVEYRRNNSDQLPRSVMYGEAGPRTSDPGARRVQERPVRVNVISRNTNQRPPEPRIFERSAPKSNRPEKSAARSSLNEKSLRDSLLLKNLGRPERMDSSPSGTAREGVQLRQGGPLKRNSDYRRSWHGGTQLSKYVVPDIDLTSRESPQRNSNVSPKIERSKCPQSAAGHPRERGTDFRFTRSGRVKPGPGFIAFDPFEGFETGRDTFGKVFKRHSDIMEDMIDIGDFQRRGLFESDWGLFADDPFRAGKKSLTKSKVKTNTEHDAMMSDSKRQPSQMSQTSFDKDDGLKTVIRVVKDSKKTPQQKKSLSPQQSLVPNRNLFDRFKFDFGSFGAIGEAEDTKHKIFFRDFDDLVKRMRNIQGISEKPQNQREKQNLSPDARLAEEHRSKNKMRTSFLREEEDEFHKLFEELLCHRNNANQQTEESTTPKEEIGMTYLGGSPKDDVKPKRASYALAESTLFEEEDDPGENPWVRKRSESLPDQPLGAQLCDNSDTTAKRSSGIFDKEEKLFADLLDDLDNISGNTNSVRRRKRARDLFSDWLFRNSGAQESPGGEEAGELSTEVSEAGEFAQAQRRKNSHRKRRPLSASDYFSERIYSDNTVVYSKRRSLVQNLMDGEEEAEMEALRLRSPLLSHSDSELTLDSSTDTSADWPEELNETDFYSQELEKTLDSPEKETPQVKNPPKSPDDPGFLPASAINPLYEFLLERNRLYHQELAAEENCDMSETNFSCANTLKLEDTLKKDFLSKDDNIDSESSDILTGLEGLKLGRGDPRTRASFKAALVQNSKQNVPTRSQSVPDYSTYESKSSSLDPRRKSTNSPEISGPEQGSVSGFSSLPGLPSIMRHRRKLAREDDADSGYHTGEGSLHKNKVPPGERTLTREDLNRRIEAFNDNNHGLYMSMEGETFQGFIRVHMNLIRPINMSISTRPPSIYEVLTNEEPEEPENTRIASFYLPKDTTKVIHITSDTTAQEVIRALLQKFKITDNPRKFALYEKVLHGDGKKGTMRRLGDDEKPLPLCLSWTSEGLDHRKFVLQENDTGEILWEAFSIPELENFLKILDREEEEYISQLKEKFKLQRAQLDYRLNEIEQERKKAAEISSSEREPVFV